MIRLLADANPSIYGSGLRSRSDWKTVAVGFSPRLFAKLGLRRRATLEGSTAKIVTMIGYAFSKSALTPALSHPMGEGESSPVLRYILQFHR